MSSLTNARTRLDPGFKNIQKSPAQLLAKLARPSAWLRVFTVTIAPVTNETDRTLISDLYATSGGGRGAGKIRLGFRSTVQGRAGTGKRNKAVVRAGKS